MNGKYAPLHRHIRKLDEDGVREWHATFAEIEQIIGDHLPSSAREYPAWWANDSSSYRQAHAWLLLGWKGSQREPHKRNRVVRTPKPLTED